MCSKTELENKIKKELGERGVLIHHRSSGKESEVAKIGDNLENLIFVTSSAMKEHLGQISRGITENNAEPRGEEVNTTQWYIESATPIFIARAFKEWTEGCYANVDGSWWCKTDAWRAVRDDENVLSNLISSDFHDHIVENKSNMKPDVYEKVLAMIHTRQVKRAIKDIHYVKDV